MSSTKDRTVVSLFHFFKRTRALETKVHLKPSGAGEGKISRISYRRRVNKIGYYM